MSWKLSTYVQFSLRKSGDIRLADRKLKDLIRLAETFGFFCCALDVRQESTIHSAVSNMFSMMLDIMQRDSPSHQYT